MLILSRKQGEKIRVGENIILTVVGIERGKVRIGFEAPKDVEIDREEVRESKNRERYESIR